MRQSGRSSSPAGTPRGGAGRDRRGAVGRVAMVIGTGRGRSSRVIEPFPVPARRGRARVAPRTLPAARAAGHSHVHLDGTLVRTDRSKAVGSTVADDKTVDLWWSGKHHHHGGNVQVVPAPDGRTPSALVTIRLRSFEGSATAVALAPACQRNQPR